MASPTSIFFFRGFTWRPLYRGILCWGRGYKVASWFFHWTHFIEAFSVGGGGIKWPVQHRFCFFRGFTWTGHFIEAFSVGEGV